MEANKDFSNVTLRMQIEAFKNDKTILGHGSTNWCHGFYDWFCRDESLLNKAKRLMPKVIKFVALNPENMIDLDNSYVFFKNNCPMDGQLYDDFRIESTISNSVIWTVVPKTGFRVDDGQAELWGTINGFSGAYMVADSWTELLKELKSK